MKNSMNVQTICKRNETGTLDFYMTIKNNEIYLFTTKYFSYNIFKEYCNGKRIEDVFHNTKMYRHQKLKERIFRMAKYASYEYSLNLFEKKDIKERRHTDYDYEVA